MIDDLSIPKYPARKFPSTSDRFGDVFIFLNRKRDWMKLLVWDHGDYVIWYKRLEVGTLELPQAEAKYYAISGDQLMLILEGIPLQSVRKRPRFVQKS